MKNNNVEVNQTIINDFITDQLARGKSKLTAKTYNHVLTKFGVWLLKNGGSLNNPTRFDIQAYINLLEGEGKSAATIDKVFSTLSVFSRFISRPGIVEDIRRPEVRKTRNIAPKSLEKNDRNKLLRAVENDDNLRNIAITYTLIYTGLRVSELVALNKEDVTINERSGSITVRNGKGNVARTVPLAPEARLHLRRYLESREDDNTAVFLSTHKKRITVRTVEHMLKKYGTHPHELRHTFCRGLVEKGVDVATVADLAGHNDINVTRRYAKPTPKQLEEAIEKAFS